MATVSSNPAGEGTASDVIGTPAISSWSFSLLRDFGGEFWTMPRFQAWRPKRKDGTRAGWIIRLGWRWTAWALSWGRTELSREQADRLAGKV